MNGLCGLCNVCSFMPEQRYERVLSIPGDEENPPLVLFIDDAPHPAQYALSVAMADWLMGERNIDFAYTSTIRCAHKPEKLSDEQLKEAASKCAVWTNSLLDNRLVVITTQRGLAQMKVGEDREPGDMFRSSKYGVVLVIPRLLELKGTVEEVYKNKVQRVLREAGLI